MGDEQQAKSESESVPKPSGSWPKSRTVRTQKEIAAFFGIALKEFHKWVADGCPGRTRGGTYDLWWIFRWRLQDLATKAAGRTGAPKDASKAEQERIKLIIANQKGLLELQQMQGELVSRKDAISHFEQMANRIRQRLEAIPAELVAGVPQEIRADLLADANHKVRLVLTEIASWSDELSDEEGGG